MTVDAILRQVDELSPADRARLIDRLLEQTERADPAAVDDDLAAFLDARVAEADANPGAACTWEEVVAYIKRPRRD